MRHRIEMLHAHLKKNPIQCVDGNSLLEQLYWCHTECNRLESDELRTQYEKIYQLLPELSEAQFDALFSQINGLLVIGRSLAFQAGVKTGLQLTVELLE